MSTQAEMSTWPGRSEREERQRREGDLRGKGRVVVVVMVVGEGVAGGWGGGTGGPTDGSRDGHCRGASSSSSCSSGASCLWPRHFSPQPQQAFAEHGGHHLRALPVLRQRGRGSSAVRPLGSPQDSEASNTPGRLLLPGDEEAEVEGGQRQDPRPWDAQGVIDH